MITFLNILVQIWLFIASSSACPARGPYKVQATQDIEVDDPDCFKKVCFPGLFCPFIYQTNENSSHPPNETKPACLDYVGICHMDAQLYDRMCGLPLIGPIFRLFLSDENKKKTYFVVCLLSGILALLTFRFRHRSQKLEEQAPNTIPNLVC